MITKFKIFEGNEVDPWGEEDWGENDKIEGYFWVCRSRNNVTDDYAKNYFEKSKPKLYSTYEIAYKALLDACCDDCGEAIYALYKNGEIKREKFRR